MISSKYLFEIIVIFNFYLVLSNGQSTDRCFNPNNRRGYCITIYDCPSLKEVIRKAQISDIDRQFLIASRCQNGYGRQPHVCCNEDKGFDISTQTTTTTRRPSVINPNIYPNPNPTRPTTVTSPSNGGGNLFPQTPDCGPQSLGDKIYNGNATDIDEFPWMVLLEYRKPSGQKSLNCGGSLINQRYVLTAAHCVTGAIVTSVGELVTVRLGEHDTSSELDCRNANDCADPIVEVGVEEIISHPNYEDRNVNRHNDIALIRLNRDITYTDFIRPVCLPSTLRLRNSATGTNLVVAGWGRTLIARQSAVKQKLNIPVVDQQRCAERFLTRKVTIANTQLCAGGRYSEDSCDGDSGGPLMKLQQDFWAIEGIVSFGYRCGLEDWPAIYTRVSEFENWIRSNVRA